MNQQSAEIVALKMELEINASPSSVWKALTENISAWWPTEFYAGGEEGKRSYLLEASPGGRMYEQWEGGGGVLWGTVYTCEPEKRLQVLGSRFPNWGGPTQWFGTWELQASGSGTTLSFSEHEMGNVSESGLAEKDHGWRFLWNNLKAHVEGTPPPAWED